MKQFMNDQNICSKYLMVLMLFFGFFSGTQTLLSDDKAAFADFQAAEGLFRLKLWNEAANSYKDYLKKHPRHEKSSEAHYGLGLAYFNLKDYAAAAKELDKAAAGKVHDSVRVNLFLAQAYLLQASPAPVHAEYAVAQSLKALGFERTGIINRKWDKDSVSKWLENNKEPKKRNFSAEVFGTLLDVSLARRDWKSIIAKVEAFKALIKDTDQEQKAILLAGMAYEELKQFSLAASSYELALSIGGPSSADAMFNLGLVRMQYLSGKEKAQYKLAAESFETFVRKYDKHPKRADAMFNQAQCYVDSYFSGEEAHLDNAIKLLGDFVKENSKHDLAEGARFRLGKLHHKNEKWQPAIEAFRPLLKTGKPEFIRAALFLGDSYSSMGNWSEATRFYMEYARADDQAKDADLALYHAGIGYTRLKMPDNQKAISVFKLLEAKRPASPWLPSARYELGHIQYQAREYNEARKTFSKIPPKHELKADANYWEAWCNLDNGKPAEAGRLFGNLRKEMEQDKPKHKLIALSHLYQGISEYEARRFDRSVKTLDTFISAHEDHARLDEAALNLGLAHMALKRWQDAVESFDKVSEKSKVRDRALYHAAWSKRSAGKVSESIDYYEELLDKYSDSEFADNASYELAEALYETGGEKGSLASVKRLTALLAKKSAVSDELRHLALQRLGIVQFDLKSFVASAKAFEELLSNDPPKELVVYSAFQAGEARYQLAGKAIGAAKKRELENALKNYNIAVTAQTVDLDDKRLRENALYRTGVVQGEMEDWGESKKTFDKFISGSPKHNLVRSAHLGVGWALHNQGDFVEAIASYNKVVKESIPDVTGARAQFLLGECYLDQKQFFTARGEFSKVIRLYKVPFWQSNALFEMGRAFELENKKKEARVVFMELIENYPDSDWAAAAKDELKRLN